MPNLHKNTGCDFPPAGLSLFFRVCASFLVPKLSSQAASPRTLVCSVWFIPRCHHSQKQELTKSQLTTKKILLSVPARFAPSRRGACPTTPTPTRKPSALRARRTGCSIYLFGVYFLKITCYFPYKRVHMCAGSAVCGHTGT